MTMRVLSIGSDRALFREGSAARVRAARYAETFGEMHVVVFSLRSHALATVHAGPLHLYPTNSRLKTLYVLDAARIARRLPADVVTVQDPFESGLVGLLARRGKPLHVQLHTDPFAAQFRRSFLNRIRTLVMPHVLARATRIRVVSERIARSLQATGYGQRAVPAVLPIYVDVARYRSAPSDAALKARFSAFKTKLLVVSRLEPEKNVKLAVSAFARVAPRDACLIIVGEGSERSLLQSFAKECACDDRIFFEGEGDPASYYKLADLVLVTSHYEGYGLVIIEALAAGTPVLSTDVGVAREAGAIVTTEEGFVDALREWLKEGPCRGELKRYPYASLDEYVQAYCDDIRACLHTNPGITV
ncbi:hypothetical protein COU20_02400 [Candidatus Kaiserbacteria bacterium CG10_big_fil_rev_8_21_14_0_10_59_10]|uniref:Glycosyl transferase family 1 domain-containing protein n=1 Tax=Candidatus Kaiserbacteria bacterium CG10_big_fil_rev_8_21_14_0_10_59_10 TaxID=1974612 RepID=A0A2H0U7U1_9BACT|nr:MAG: hypothetical protein COU20_02400 [Candidatus Kaiserbacteria bacterium CG10_big_fil_rev_8_21_14_0_10_59_10]